MSDFNRGLIVGMMIIGVASLVSGLNDDNAHGEIVFGVAMFGALCLGLALPKRKDPAP